MACRVGTPPDRAPYAPAPRTPQPQPAVTPPSTTAPRPYAQPRTRYIEPSPHREPRRTRDRTGLAIPGYDGTAQEYARLMRLCDRLTGTTSSYSNTRAWPQHALTGTEEAA